MSVWRWMASWGEGGFFFWVQRNKNEKKMGVEWGGVRLRLRDQNRE